MFHCDDSTAFRVLVREMLREMGDVDVVGEAANLDEALERLPRTDAEVVLVDLFERDRAAQLLELLREAAPGAALLLYTGMPADAAPGGAEGHVHKSAAFPDLHRAILAAARPG